MDGIKHKSVEQGPRAHAAPKLERSTKDEIRATTGGATTTSAIFGTTGTDVQRVQLRWEPAARPFTSKVNIRTVGRFDVMEFRKKGSKEAETEERRSQEQYEEFMETSSAIREETAKEFSGLNNDS